MLLFPGHGSSYPFIFGFVTSVDFNTVQVTNIALLHSFVSEDCHKSYFTLRGKLSSDGSTQNTYVKMKEWDVVIEVSLRFSMSLMCTANRIGQNRKEVRFQSI